MHQLFESFKRHAAQAGAFIAISDDESELSRRELFARVAHFAMELRRAPRTVGILAPNGIDWVIAQLACAFAGKTVVPLPTFFSATQLEHIVRDASVEFILASERTAEPALRSGLPGRAIRSERIGTDLPEPVDGFGQIIYTSGSTGRPKGVRHESGQIAWSAAAQIAATQASAEDSYLSVLPLPLLLETICSVFVPTALGARVHFDAGLAERIGRGDASGIARAFDLQRPTASVLVPQLLKHWVAELEAARQSAPSSLRLVAVGGAPVPAAVADAAWRSGIPAYEGYGLSECCSVVAVNRPDERRPGTVGRPLGGLTVSIDEGEIVVDGPSIMDGYIGGTASRPWRTGDLGAIDEDGYLTVHGRKDSLIVTAFGRNVSPEWIETMLLADPRIAFCAVAGHGAPHLTALLVPSVRGAGWFATAGEAEVLDLCVRLCAGAPHYAVPRAAVVTRIEDALKHGLLSNGRPARKAIAHFLEDGTAAPARSHLTSSIST